MEKYKPEQRLAEAIGFTEHDLAYNTDGQLSAAQRNRIRTEGAQMLQYGYTALMIGFAAFIGLLLLVRPGLMTIGSFALVIGGITGGAFLLLLWLSSRMIADSKAAPAAAEGRVKLDVMSDDKAGLRFSLEVEGQKFIVRKDVMLAFKNGDPYRIYYTPRTKRILSAEWLRE